LLQFYTRVENGKANEQKLLLFLLDYEEFYFNPAFGSLHCVERVAEGSGAHAATIFSAKISSASTLKMEASWPCKTSATLSVYCKHPRTGLTSTVYCHEILKSISKQSYYSQNTEHVQRRK
jgi:hypothetical protein